MNKPGTRLQVYRDTDEYGFPDWVPTMKDNPTGIRTRTLILWLRWGINGLLVMHGFPEQQDEPSSERSMVQWGDRSKPPRYARLPGPTAEQE